MADEVTNTLMFEVLKSIQSGQKDMQAQLHSIREEIGALRTHMNAFQSDVSNLYAGQVEMNKRLSSVENILNISKVDD